jgi:lysophospholipase L1-like esterase
MKKAFCFLATFLFLVQLAGAQTAPPFWNEIIAFKKSDSVQAPPENEILLVGSSSFRMWKDVGAAFPGYSIINRGFGGSTLADVIRYSYDIILPYKPRQVLIYCGENDLASPDSISADEVVRRFRTLFAIIRTNLPGATIDFVSIKPSPSRAALQHKMKDANQQIRRFLKKQRRAHFIDIYDAMLNKDGTMREELYLPDRLHMKPEGYAIWQRVLMPYLTKQ